jgi:hypothetical protein
MSNADIEISKKNPCESLEHFRKRAIGFSTPTSLIAAALGIDVLMPSLSDKLT